MQDGHVPPEGRAAIHAAMSSAGVDFSWCELNARHAFIRDELSKGRYDPALTAVVHQLMFELFDRRLLLGMPSTAAVEAQTSSAGPADC
jgi:carboxymethylenebutenolidase